jgi:hypothetical protein
LASSAQRQMRNRSEKKSNDIFKRH